MNLLAEETSINKFSEKFRINYVGDLVQNKQKISKSKIVIILKLMDTEDNIITKEIEFSLHEINQKNV